LRLKSDMDGIIRSFFSFTMSGFLCLQVLNHVFPPLLSVSLCLCLSLSLSVGLELPLPDLPAHVELHALQAAQRVRQEHRGGHRPRAQLQLRLPAGEYNERVLPPAQLQSDADRRPAGHQGLRHRHASGSVLWEDGDPQGGGAVIGNSSERAGTKSIFAR